MNIFWQELRFYRKSLLIWVLALSTTLIVFLSSYQSISSQIDVFREVVSHYPKALLLVINFRFEIFYTIYGYFGYILTFIWLAGAIQAMNYGVSILSKEVTDKTADFLLSKPVSRSRILTEKFAAGLSLIVITNICFTVTALLGAKYFSHSNFGIKTFIMLSATLFFVQVFFLVLGFLFGTILPKIKTVLSVALPTVFIFFIVASFGGILDKPDFYYLTPFKYFDPVYIYQNSGYDPKYLFALGGFVVTSLVLSYIVYIRKDIKL